MQQPADFFCKEIPSERHRLEDPFPFHSRASGSEGIEDPADRESASLGGASPLSPTNLRSLSFGSASQFTESKPQQTGIGLLIRHGEVATTSGSTNSLPGRLTVGPRPLKALVLVRAQPRQPASQSAPAGYKFGK